MNSPSPRAGKPRFTARQLALYGMLAAMMIAGQVAMAPLPNIEPVSLLVIAGAVVFGWGILLPVCVFVLAEGLIYGFGLWFLNYLYVWTVLALTAIFFRRQRGRLLWAAVSGFFGLAFGFLCSLPYVFIIGPMGAVAYFISGIPFDLLHGAGNFCLALVLLPRCISVLERLNSGKIRP